MGEVQTDFQLTSSVNSVTGKPKSPAEASVRAGQVELCVGLLQDADGLLKCAQRVVSGLGERSALQSKA
jgi:hypothetical protein